ncbi:Triacylglycerol lipase [Aphelenchoides besseyi]|nr:Triacylglycerol lipase [Aphelenchoides besseyi]
MGKVHRYFYRAFITLWNGGMKEEFELLAQQYPDYSIHVQGHSLGAALSSLASAAIMLDGRTRNCQLCSQPRVGDAQYAAAHSRLIWYNNTMEPGSPYVVCESECPGERNSWDDHRMYFSIHIAQYGLAGCPTNVL